MARLVVPGIVGFARSYATKLEGYYDIIIVGGGMVGNTMACAVGHSKRLSSKTVLVLESGEPKVPLKESPYTNRVSAVSPPAVSLFKELGIWDKLLGLRVKRIDRLEVLDGCSQSSVRFEQSNPRDEIAYIIENNVMIGLLAERIKERCPNVTIKTLAKVVNCSLPGGLHDLASVELDDGTVLQTSLVVGADGVRSLVRKVMNPSYTTWEYGQTAIVANLKVQALENNCVAFQRFTPSGPIALLPLTTDMSSVTWALYAKEAEEIMALSPDEFVDELNRRLTTSVHQNTITNQILSFTGQTLQRVFGVSEKYRPVLPTVISMLEGTRASFPLGFGHSHTYVAPRVALVGDAAHRTHPLAGQGVNLGWSDVKILVHCLEECVAQGGDLG